MICENEVGFPELFQVSHKWIYDLGASKHFCSKDRARYFRDHMHKVTVAYVSTASDLVVMDQALTIEMKRSEGLLVDVSQLATAKGVLLSLGLRILALLGFQHHSQDNRFRRLWKATKDHRRRNIR